jgi:hypothetical protein
MRVDESRFDGVLVLAHQRIKGVWAGQMLTVGSRLTRVAGRYKNSTTDSLLTLALVSGLQSVPSKRVELLTERRSGAKPRIQVLCGDATYVEAMGRNDNTTDLFVNRFLLGRLAGQKRRFDLTFEHIDPLSQQVGALTTWAITNVMIDGDRMPLIPCVVSALGKKEHRAGVNVAW